MKKIIAANWKMNHAFDEVDVWMDGFFKNYSDKYDELQKVEMVLCPPAFLLDYIDSELINDSFDDLEEIMKRDHKKVEDFSAEELSAIMLDQRPIRLGGQDCHHELAGSFTGDISATMLKKVGCEYVIIGHSERRETHFENNEIVVKKVQAALSQNLTPIICVGESKKVRDEGKHLEFVYKQIKDSIPPEVNFTKLVIAYEPIWSIGTGQTPTVAQIAEMAKLLGKIFNEKLQNRAQEFFMLYGGSVTSQNAKEILAINGVGGLLVGKASLDVEEFIKICL